MSSSEPAPPKLSLDDLVTLSEAELVEHLKRTRGPDGGFHIQATAGWGHLSEDQRDSLAERLRALALKANDHVQSRPVDPDQLAARLLNISDKDTSTPAASRSPRYDERPRTVTPSPPQEFEKDHYNELVRDGGRPSYPISLVYEVSNNPEQYREVLQPWQDRPEISPPEWTVFGAQLERWQDFRQWQKDNRGILHDGFPAFAQSQQRLYGRQLLDPCTEESWKPGWVHKQYHRRRDLRHLREDRGPGGFTKYAEEVKRRLAQHDFTQPFQLDQDPERQDKLTTWIEYLNYECSWYDRYTRDVKRLQPRHHEAWKKLVDTGVLGPSETEEYLYTTESALQTQRNIDLATKAVETSKSTAMAVVRLTEKSRKDPQSDLTGSMRLQMVSKALCGMDKAEESLRTIKRRAELVTKFIRGSWSYKRARRNVERHSILLRWIREQVPLIEAELKESKTAEASSHAGRCTKRRRQDDQVTDEKSSKKQRLINKIGWLSRGC